ncbi:HEPN domain-containing protein [Mucilaginibacter arboris]|uniref:HEPN domain-containing protein n=1 Tax=Mucilaginibacter arboris TaxID=2682090 RepID=A0A7K1T1E1_9SPHI|nr:HEPN domain-containing protein [Mucilaginibacter arboris]MVN23347.1 HEPN domain-containing protein [Mucilaginibacter arboris]
MIEKLLQDLANSRIKESKVLLNNNCFNGAYYLAGYAIECALKACIAKNIKASEIPDKKFINDIFTHDVKSLVKLAGLEVYRRIKESTDPDFSINWAIVKDWNEGARYKEWPKQEATQIYEAIMDKKGGILLWIQQYW